jgi:hypothetical protein
MTPSVWREPRWTARVTSAVICRPLPQISATIRGVMDQAPSPTSLLLMTNPANRMGSVPGW